MILDLKCSHCGKRCSGHWLDFGVGVTEAWGERHTDKSLEFVSSCCDADLLEFRYDSDDDGEWLPYHHPDTPTRIL